MIDRLADRELHDLRARNRDILYWLNISKEKPIGNTHVFEISAGLETATNKEAERPAQRTFNLISV